MTDNIPSLQIDSILQRSRRKEFSGLRELVEQYVSQYVGDQRVVEAFVWSGLSNDVALVKAYLDAGIPVISESKAHQIVHLASRIPFPEFLKEILRFGASVDARNSQFATPLILVTQQGKDFPDRRAEWQQMAVALMDQQADINAADLYNLTALDYACSGRWESLGLLLLERGARLNQCDENGWWCLRSAVQGGDTTLLEALMQSPNAVGIAEKQSGGLSVLEYAVKNGWVRHLEVLLSAGANPTLPDGTSALEAANKHVEALSSLDSMLSQFGINRHQ